MQKLKCGPKPFRIPIGSMVRITELYKDEESILVGKVFRLKKCHSKFKSNKKTNTKTYVSGIFESEDGTIIFIHKARFESIEPSQATMYRKGYKMGYKGWEKK